MANNVIGRTSICSREWLAIADRYAATGRLVVARRIRSSGRVVVSLDGGRAIDLRAAVRDMTEALSRTD